MTAAETNTVSALCARLRQLAEEAGQAALTAKRQQADTLVAEALAAAETESATELDRRRQMLDRERDRALQNARLEARARVARCRWQLLDEVLHDAEQAIVQIRQQNPRRYTEALLRLFERSDACRTTNESLVVEVHAGDVAPLQRELGTCAGMSNRAVEVRAADIAAGVRVTTAAGDVLWDESVSERRHRLDAPLRGFVSQRLFQPPGASPACPPRPRAQGDAAGAGEPTALAYHRRLDFHGSLMHVGGARGVGFDERAEVRGSDGSIRSGQVLSTDEAETVVQVFEGTAALQRAGTAVRFLGRVPELIVREDLLGRVFDGLGRPRDDMPPILGDRRESLRGRAINPVARAYPCDFIQTGISAIDVLNSLVRGQKLPIFTGNGLPHNALVAQIVRQARLRDDASRFALVFVAMGLCFRDAQFFREVAAAEGVMEHVAMFVSLADDPPVLRLAAPRAGLTAAEFLAFERDYHVLVILNDMTHYADALREVSTARNEVPARKGYPGYLYSDLAEIYERAGRIRGHGGSITLMPVVTLPSDDITHPVPDLTGYITEGQIVLSRGLHHRGIEPPIDVLPSLSRLMKDGIGATRTRADHANLASQLYAAYAEARQVRDLAAVIGEADLSQLDRQYLQFGTAFECEFVNQAATENRSITESLERGWRLLRLLPEEELTRVTVEELKEHR
jgi:V/A-type H+-transporting ATPase subunit B